MASSRLPLLESLCSFLILTTFISRTQSASCCLQYVKRPLPCRQVIGYTVQTIVSSCDINAVIFHTRRRGFVCADPSKQWTMKRIKCLETRLRKVGLRGRKP